jgi:hypothetical protein
MIEKIDQDLKQAMRDKDQVKLRTLRFVKSALKNREIELGRELDESDIASLLKSQVKSREQSAQMYRQGKRDDLADLEEKEIAIIKKYLPKELSEAEIDKAVDDIIAQTGASSPADIGIVMKTMMQKYQNRVDGKLVKDIVKKKLTK